MQPDILDHPARRLEQEQASGERHVIHRGLSPGRDGALLQRHETGKALNRLQLVELLSAASPAIASTQRSHVRSFGFLVHHVFLDEVLCRLGECLGPDARAGDDAEVRALLDAIERGIDRGDRDTKDLVARCFARDSARRPFFERLKPFTGPRLRALLPRR